jgi:hypothetical protein
MHPPARLAAAGVRVLNMTAMDETRRLVVQRKVILTLVYVV